MSKLYLLHPQLVHGHVSQNSTSELCQKLIIAFSMYGFYYLMFATFPIVYTGTYGFSTGIAGLVSMLACVFDITFEILDRLI